MASYRGRSTWSLEVALRLFRTQSIRVIFDAVMNGGAHVVGAALLTGGAGLAFLLAGIIDLAIANTDDVGTRLWRVAALTATFAVPLVFCGYVGFRLLLNRPTKNGTLFSSVCWALTGLVLVVCEGFAIFIARAEIAGSGKLQLSLLGLFLLSVASFRIAYAVRKGPGDEGATSNYRLERP